MVLRAECLCRKSARAHADEGAVPVDEVEDGNTNRERTDGERSLAATSAASDECRGYTHEGHRNIRDDVRYCYSKYLSVHNGDKVTIILQKFWHTLCKRVVDQKK